MLNRLLRWLILTASDPALVWSLAAAVQTLACYGCMYVYADNPSYKMGWFMAVMVVYYARVTYKFIHDTLQEYHAKVKALRYELYEVKNRL